MASREEKRIRGQQSNSRTEDEDISNRLTAVEAAAEAAAATRDASFRC